MPPSDGSIRTGHRVLHGVAQQQEQSQIEGRHLPHFALAAEPYAQQDDGINHRRPQRDADQNMTARIHAFYWVAVIGVGAPFGVLRYPVALSLSTVQTTSS